MKLTANQIVAARLVLARASLRWSQQQAVDELARHGLHWSVPVYSAAERSVDGRRPRQFDADTVVALSRAFGYPIAWWYAPLPAADRFGLLPQIIPRPGKVALTPDELVEAIIGRRGNALSEALIDAAPTLSAATRQLLREHIEPEPPEEEGS